MAFTVGGGCVCFFFFPKKKRLCKVSKPLPQKTEKLREVGICDRTSLPHLIRPGLCSAC